MRGMADVNQWPFILLAVWTETSGERVGSTQEGCDDVGYECGFLEGKSMKRVVNNAFIIKIILVK